jgi:C_GCAxxG_C_C family probable redox protein
MLILRSTINQPTITIMKHVSEISRRRFLGSASALALGTSLLSFKSIENLDTESISPINELWSDLSGEEKLKIESSARAQYIVTIDGKSCAEKVLQTTLNSYKKPEELVSFAASFGGGMKKGDLCGMLTGGFMSIGFAADILIEEKDERPDWVKDRTNEFWDWWEERAPKHCEDLKPLYARKNKGEHLANFNNMLQRVALKLDEMFDPMV